MSRFKPVDVPLSLDRRASMTFLRHANSCMRSGYLYELHKKTPVQTMKMVRGSACHEILERCTRAAMDTGEVEIPPEIAKAIVNEVLAEQPVPMEEHDYIRELAFRWAGEWRFNEKIVACETLYVLELGGWTVRCKVDFATVPAPGRIYIADYKSGRGALSSDDVARKRSDGTMAAKNFQLVVYILAVVFGVPVTVEPCDPCRGSGKLSPLPPGKTGPVDCHVCDGRGTIETPGEQVARGATEAIAEFVYPGVEDSQGLMLRRTAGLTRVEMLEYRESLEALLVRVAAAEESGDWPALIPENGCQECPCVAACPIPEELRDYQGTINTLEEASAAAERRFVRRKRDEALGRELKALSKARGLPIRFGKDRVLDFSYVESERIDSKDELFAALERGEQVNRSDYAKVVKSTTFSERKLTEDEIERENADGGIDAEQAA